MCEINFPFTFFWFQLVHRELTMTERDLYAQVCLLSLITPFLPEMICSTIVMQKENKF